MSSLDKSFEKAMAAAAPPFAVGERVRTKSGHTGVVENAREVEYYGWYATVKVDGGGSWDGAMSELLAARKPGAKIPISTKKSSGHVWKSDINDRKSSVGHADWGWAKRTAKPEDLQISVAAWDASGKAAHNTLGQEFSIDRESEKGAKDYARRLVESGQSAMTQVRYNVRVWDHKFGRHEKVWRTVEETIYEPANE